MMDAVVTVALEVAKCLFLPIWRRLSYVRNYKANLDNLKKEAETLTVARDSMQKKVDGARRNGEEIDKRVESWLISVDKIIAEADTLTGEEEDANKKCFKGLCPNLKKRYQLSKKAATKEKSIAELKEEAEKFAQISYRTVPEEPWLRSGKGYEAFESRMSTLKNVQNALLDPDGSIIGVYGMAGIGKTTLVKEVARRAKKDELFDKVVFAEVSETPDIRKVQVELADQLLMEFSEESDVPGRARKLYARLQKENKILVFLDNNWEDLDLEKVGIPSGNDCRGCKVLLTARDRHVLECMGSKTFQIDVLNEEEAWILFKKMAGDCTEKGELNSVAIDIAKECGGLPIAIVTLAKALRNKSSVSTWKDALRQLKRPSHGNFEGVLAKPYSAVELSYKCLREEELKKLFLQCSLMGYQQASMLDLLKYGVGLGIVKGVSTMEEARDKVNALVDQLKDACLLLDGKNSDWFSMHDVVRHAAISIATRDCHVFTMRNEVDQRQWPDKHLLKKCSTISLDNINNSEIPPGWECPQLELFFISAPKDSPLKIPDNIFIGMPRLKVLDFTSMRLLSLPSSIHLLTDIRTLCLDGCELEDIRVIGELKKLEILSLRNSEIEQLPREIGQMTQLKLLDLSDCSKLKVIAPNVLSNLSQLEELYMANCPIEWEVLGLNTERSNASLDELKNLSRLSTLEICILDTGILPSGFFSRKLERYRIVIGDKWDRFDKYKTRRDLKLNLNSSICLEERRGMKNVEYLCLEELQGLTNVLHDLDEEGFAELKHLNVQNNPNFQCIVDPVQVRCGAFPMLESLVLKNLINLERICHGQLQAGSFCNLKTIEVEGCDNLKNLFSFSIAKFLSQLETIEVSECKNVQEVFVSSNKEAAVIGEIAMGQVRSLILRTLPLFTGFSAYVKSTSTVEVKHSEIILENENQAYTPPSLFNEKLVLPNLEVLELRNINVAKMWHKQLSEMACNVQNLTRLIVVDCRILKYVFSYSTAKRVGQLQHLEICRCPLLEEIVGKEGGVEADPSFVFPRLTILQLSSLPELRAFYPGVHTLECPMLTKLEVSFCDKLQSFSSELYSLQENNEGGQIIDVPVPAQQPLFLVEKVLPNLEELRLSKKDITKIWRGPFPDHLLNKLKVLAIANDESVVLALDLLERFRNLVNLELANSYYKELFSNEGQVEKHVGMLAQIKNLALTGLDNLKHLWLCEENSKLNTIFQNLETLSVYICPNLTILMPSSASFLCLRELNIWNCLQLKNLVTSSAAKNLVQLVRMTVGGCTTMTEAVVASERDSPNDEIIFPKLECLTLVGLHSLTTFCSANYTLKFPSLLLLSVYDCPKMKIFCGGVLSTPRLKIASLNGQNCWDCDFNTAIQHSYYKTNAQSSTNDSGQSSMHPPE